MKVENPGLYDIDQIDMPEGQSFEVGQLISNDNGNRLALADDESLWIGVVINLHLDVKPNRYELVYIDSSVILTVDWSKDLSWVIKGMAVCLSSDANSICENKSCKCFLVIDVDERYGIRLKPLQKRLMF